MFHKFFMCLFMLFAFQSIHSQSFKLKLTDHDANVETVTVSTDGKYMASGSWDGRINMYTFDTFNNPIFMHTYIGHLGAVTGLCFSQNDKYLVSCSKDYSARIWNIDTPSKHKVYNLHSEPVTSAFIDQTYKFLITSSMDGTIRTTNINDASKSKVIKLNTPINDLQLSKDRKYFYVALKGGIIKKIETGGSNAELLVFTGHTDEVNAIELSPDGLSMASASSDKTMQIWDINTGKSIKKLNGFEWKVTSLKYTVDGKYIIGGCNNGIAKLYEVESGKSISDFNTLGKNVRDVYFSKDGTQIYVATLMDSEKFGVVIYNSGISSGIPPAMPKSTPNKAKAKPTTNKKVNGSK